MQRAVEFEFERQVGLLEAGRGAEIVQETRLWNEDKRETFTMRKKEGAADYRYLPEPDVLPLAVSDAEIGAQREGLPELPSAKRERLRGLGLPVADAFVLADDVQVAAYFDESVAAGAPAKQAANWIMGDITGWLKQEGKGISEAALPPAGLAAMVGLIEDGTISGKIGKEILPQLLAEGGDPKELVEAKGLVQISDASALESIIDEVLAANPGQLEQYRAGKTKLKGFFVGQIMKASKGQANPAMVQQLLDGKLAG